MNDSIVMYIWIGWIAAYRLLHGLMQVSASNQDFDTELEGPISILDCPE